MGGGLRTSRVDTTSCPYQYNCILPFWKEEKTRYLYIRIVGFHSLRYYWYDIGWKGTIFRVHIMYRSSYLFTKICRNVRKWESVHPYMTILRILGFLKIRTFYRDYLIKKALFSSFFSYFFSFFTIFSKFSRFAQLYNVYFMISNEFFTI